MNNKMRTLLRAATCFGLVLIGTGGCSRHDAEGRAIDTLPKEIVPSSFDLQHSVFWMDDQRVVFEGAPRRKVGDSVIHDKDSGGIYIWNLADDTVSLYRPRATALCFDGETISYVAWEPGPASVADAGAPFSPSRTIVGHGKATFMSGRFGSEVPGDLESRGAYSPVTCDNRQVITKLASGVVYPLREPGLELAIEYTGHVTLIDVAQSHAVRLFENKPRSIALLDFLPFENAYVASWSSDATRIPGTESHLYRFDTKGASKSFTVQPGALSGMLYFKVSAAGVLVVATDLRSRTDIGDSGLHLASSSVPTLLRAGFISEVKVSPDGCRVAYARADSSFAKSSSGGLKATLEVINLCAQANQLNR